MYAKSAKFVYGVLMDTAYKRIYFIQVTINSVTDCDTYDISISNKQIVEFFSAGDNVYGTNASFITNSAGGDQ